MEYPKLLQGDRISPTYRDLISRVALGILEGSTPQHALLRAQLKAARLRDVKLTGVGFYAHFDVPNEAAAVVPPNITGGHARIELDVVPSGAGALLMIRDGRLESLEIYTYGSEAWPDDPRGLSIKEFEPLPIAAPAK